MINLSQFGESETSAGARFVPGTAATTVAVPGRAAGGRPVGRRWRAGARHRQWRAAWIGAAGLTWRGALSAPLSVIPV